MAKENGISEDYVLIETYWNVKREESEKQTSREHVLIETYWNVKSGVIPAFLYS